MDPVAPFYREAGAGPGVVCLHANASSSGQWSSLLNLLAPDFHVLAPDLHGAGRSPPWPSDRVIGLRDEAALIEPVLARAGAPLALVGHSYGAAVALIAALSDPGRVRALALYEPTLFAVVDAQSPAPNDADGIRNAVALAGAALDAGNADTAGREFIDYWMGPGSWQRTPTPHKLLIAASVANVRGWAHALFGEPTPLQAYRRLDMPVLLMVGAQSPLSARAVARVLASLLPQVELMELEGLGHMGPVTQAAQVNTAIKRFLDRVGR